MELLILTSHIYHIFVRNVRDMGTVKAVATELSHTESNNMTFYILIRLFPFMVTFYDAQDVYQMFSSVKNIYTHRVKTTMHDDVTMVTT